MGMATNKLLVVDLHEEQASVVAQVLANKTCRAVLDYLAEHTATESELAEKLGVPLSTMHYNLQQLLKSKLVVSEEFHYSKRGKTVPHYTLANKYIIIAPKKESSFSLRQKLKGLLPVGVLSAGIAGLLQWYHTFERPVIAATEVAMMRADISEYQIEDVAEVATPVMQYAEPAVQTLPPAIWFFAGVLCALFLVVLFEILRSRRKNTSKLKKLE